jgi:hypothetical protein
MMKQRRTFLGAVVLVLFCSTPFNLAMGGVAPVLDGGTSCTVSTSTVVLQNETVITQTTRCSDGSTQVCTTIITNTSTNYSCDDSAALNFLRKGCKVNA